jgi:DNA-binding LacI/PurR family transcriptional regulator
MTKRINAEDVARLAGVSKTTVSRAFAADSSISASKKTRVMDAAKRLGYRPNALARSLRTTKSKLIGVVLEEFTNPLFLRILELITRKLQENGLYAVAVNAAKGIGVAEAMELVMQYRIDGLIVSSDIPLKIEYECAAMNVPVIVFARSDKRIAGTYGICLDDEAVGKAAAHHLVDQGYRKMAFLGGFPGVSVSVDRETGFRMGLAERGLTVCRVEYAGENTYDLGRAAGQRLLAGSDAPDAVFCVNDQVAIGLMDAATRDVGLKIPSQLGVVGVDNIWMARTAQYNLTTIAQPLDEMADAMISLILGTAETSDRGDTILLQGTLVPGDSTRR